MGGQKKKPLAKTDKKKEPEPAKTEKQTKVKFSKVQAKVTMPKMDGNEADKIFIPMKAVTIYSTAKTLGINVSLANSLIKNMEGKGMLEKMGGYSGHYVYKYIHSGKKIN